MKLLIKFQLNFWLIFLSCSLLAQEKTLSESVLLYLKADPDSEKEWLQKIVATKPTYQKLHLLLKEASLYKPKPSGIHRRTFLATSDKKPYEAEYYVIVPQNYNPKQKYPLILEIHGTFGTGQKIANYRLPLSLPYFFLCPSSKESGIGWRVTKEEREVQIKALLKTLAEYSIDWNQIYLTGGSRGGHATWDLGIHHSDFFAALFPVAGGPRLAFLKLLENLKYLPIKDVQGALDDPRLVANLRYANQKLTQLKYPIIYQEHADQGHAVRWNYQETLEFFKGKSRNPHPKEIICYTQEKQYGERFWLQILKVTKKAETPKKLFIKNFQKMSPAQQSKAYIETLEKYRATLIANITEKNKIQIKSKYVREIEIRLDPVLLDPTKPIVVQCNGKQIWKGRIKWSPRFCLQHFKKFRDLNRLYWGTKKLKLPK